VMHSVGSGALEKEEEFVQKCMESLSAASSQLDQVSVADENISMLFFMRLVFIVCIVDGETELFMVSKNRKIFSSEVACTKFVQFVCIRIYLFSCCTDFCLFLFDVYDYMKNSSLL